ncbi:MAG: porin, partial [Gammaproteobacteria bacterium]|nr:porin [Gammaproteobacteria bacterium]
MRTVKSLLCTAGAAAVLGLAPMSATAYDFKDVFDGKVKFSIGGYAKLSSMFTDTSDGEIAGTSAGRTFYVPSATPIGGESGDAVLDMTARESRINFKGKTEGGGHKLGVVLEMDFLTTTEGNEKVSNSFAPRMRHYFFTYDNWLFGQTWHTFMDTGALPDALDFLGAPESTVFGRQPMIRYSSGPFQVALENPETVTNLGASDDNILPDLAGNYKIKGDWGHVRVNGLLRQLKVDNPADGVDDDTVGWGIGVTGKMKVFGADDIRASV